MGYKRGRQIELTLVPIPGGFFLEEVAAKQFNLMYEAAKKAGIILKVNTAFRDMDHQKRLYRTFQKNIDKGRNPAPVARPGYSNHQAGTAVDINRAPGDDLKTKKPDSPVDLWLTENAKTYGYKRTVPSESWHYEFGGV